MFKAYSNRSYSLIGITNKKKPRFLDLLSIIKQYYPVEVKESLDLIKLIDETIIEGILEPIPEEVMSVTHKEWVKRLLLYRKEWLLNWYKGGVNNGKETFCLMDDLAKPRD